jgi:hypothetical protein
MLQCSGIVAIPEDHMLKIAPYGKGSYFDFNVVAQEKTNEGEVVFHRYHANMWVKEEDVERWRGDIEHGNVFQIKTANWSSKIADDKQYPFTILKLSPYNFIRLKSALWYTE